MTAEHIEVEAMGMELATNLPKIWVDYTEKKFISM
jgi:hypothetical protein